MSTPLLMGWQPSVHWLTTFLKTQWSRSRAALETGPLLPQHRRNSDISDFRTPLQSDAHPGQHGGEPPCYKLLNSRLRLTPFTTKSWTEDGWLLRFYFTDPSPLFRGGVEGVEVVEAVP